MYKRIKAAAIAMVMAMGMTCAFGCGGGNESVSSPEDDSSSVSSAETETIKYTKISGEENFTLAPDEKKTVMIGRDIGEANYFSIELTTTENLEGSFNYAASDNSDERKTELFFIDAEAKEPFNQLIDWFSRVGEPTRESEDQLYKIPETWYERKEYKKTVDSVTFTNKGENSATVAISSIKVAKRDMVLDKTVYIQNDYIKAGVNLGWGGGVGFLTRTDKNVQQVVVGDKNMVGVNYANKDGAKLIGDHVNLINSSTAGRSAQVSLYGKNTDDDTYTRAIYRTTKASWCYNPVQCGDQWDTHSQVVDYRISDTEIYVKTRPRDWAPCETTKAYTECTYTLVGKCIKAKNRFYDWSGLTHDKYENGELVPNRRNQEMPALSAVVPLHTMVLYEGDSPWTNANLTRRENLGYWSVASGQAGEYLSTSKARECWAAWFNDDDFGLGLFVPQIEKAVAGRHLNYNLSFTGAADKQIQFNYLTFLGVFALESYEPLDYEFYLTCDNVTNMRKTFKKLNETEGVGNANVLEWQQKRMESLK